MKKLIIHVGPGKCGSSSIQDFFKSHKRPCKERVKFIEIHPDHIDLLNQEQPDSTFLSSFAKNILKQSSRCNTLILSHEYIFLCPLAIKNIIAFFRNKVNEVKIIGYSRRQSDFLVSAYSQWFFRSKERVTEIKATLKENSIDSKYFTGLEQFMIAAILSNFFSARHFTNRIIFNWNESYNRIQENNTNIDIKCGTLPKKERDTSLVEDFCIKAGLKLKDRLKEAAKVKVNSSFNQDLIEAINIATGIDCEITTPHADNDSLIRISNSMEPKRKEGPFLEELKKFVDACYLDDNILLCERFSLDPDYFKVEKEKSSQEINNVIKDEFQERIKQNRVLQDYKTLIAKIANTCFKMAKEEKQKT